MIIEIIIYTFITINSCNNIYSIISISVNININ